MDKYFEKAFKIGSGTTAEVYRAVNKKSGNRVAVKKFSKIIVEDPQLKKALVNGLKKVSVLKHPNLVRSFHTYMDEENIFLERELVHGKNFDQWLRSYELKLAEPVYWILTQALRALGHAHSLGIFHGDIKAENILISTEGEVKISDFALANLISKNNRAKKDILVGSIEHMAPEYVESQLASVSTDIFSFGVMAFHCLSGEFPFEGVQQPMRKGSLAHRQIKDLHLLNPIVDVKVCRLIEQCLHVDPKKRPKRASEIEAQLIQVLNRSGIHKSCKGLVSENSGGKFKQNAVNIKHDRLLSQINHGIERGGADAGLLLRISAFRELFPRSPQTALLMKKLEARKGEERRHLDWRYSIAIAGLSALAFIGIGLLMKSPEVPSPNAELTVQREFVAPPILTKKKPKYPAIPLAELPNEAIEKPKTVVKPKSQLEISGHGFIKFAVPKGIDVYVDDLIVPFNQHKKFKAESGKRRITFLKQGFIPIEKTVDIKPGRVATINVNSEKK